MSVSFSYPELFVTGQPWNKIDLGGVTYSRNVTVRGVFQFDGMPDGPLSGITPRWPESGLAFTMLLEIKRDSDDFISRETHATSGQTANYFDGAPQTEKYKMVGEFPLVGLAAGLRYKFQLYVNYTICKIQGTSGYCTEWHTPSMESMWTFRDEMRFTVAPSEKIHDTGGA